MRSCGASLMRMEGTANGGEYEEEEAWQRGKSDGVERKREGRWSLGEGW